VELALKVIGSEKGFVPSVFVATALLLGEEILIDGVGTAGGFVAVGAIDAVVAVAVGANVAVGSDAVVAVGAATLPVDVDAPPDPPDSQDAST
jgi:hypothetical protein